ncbi:Uncharacterized protein YjbI, contains pentapeptide repeats [Prosthecobacter debontii]|uniref:Uncharacterized protein YjbI, contains pentapeptide repeats n=1 Tax=Prosthecobacter debontii TaxID=48467 RepID=A0A1T4YDS6_9BACT|nr:toll/interleukin-1 receptor domain-containing protein [Prosthecobacter debontii]SKA99840.1 Uncharacterized protein YjbI, contains pentapeptide repeats [Prosthecobacter debontii]
MANSQHLEILNQGVTAWNEWRKNNKQRQSLDLTEAQLSHKTFVKADLSGADLSKSFLFGADLRGADLSGAELSGTDFREADLSGANLREADLTAACLMNAQFIRTDLIGATLHGANLSYAVLTDAKLNGANLIDADLSLADLTSADLRDSKLQGAKFLDSLLICANLSYAQFGTTVLANVRLSTTIGLESAIHNYPSSIGIDTLYLSKGKIPEVFLRGCGVPDSFITQAKALIGAEEGIQFYSCFISYNSKDEAFATRLHARLQQDHVRVWYAPHDIQGGKKLHEQIDEAIKIHDKLLILLSPNSLKSEWVMTELRKARKAERKTGQRKLFPIGLVDYETLREWECFDADGGQDLAVEVRQYYIPDFTLWKDHDVFEKEYTRLLKDLRAEAKPIL